ncbi:glycoside hydrolase family 5 protein [Sphingobacterium sp. ML3W]|uniref:glycoside hydrolase family 5 protein n=1 Tax=Sphingobacterium sp. ML3W TaxID=1538644 RepID=UPI00249CCB6B|nr:glycoside hydrolase family 5 protein [Sphingobacterium sp. ML3W]WFA82123.1 glycoside hydrolase family 5 protein [Sphingobacterium sp. ML3W]
MKTFLSYIIMLLILPACSSKEIKANMELNTPEANEEPQPTYSKFLIRDNFSTNQLVDEMGLGINLGNALDATGDWINPSSIANYETAWGSPIITKEMIEGYANAGYSSLRIPVTWSNMMINEENYRIHPDLLNRVESILNWTLDCGMVAIINVHHENEWVKKVPTDNEAKKKFTSIWEQLCNRFEKYGDHLLFEPMNEIGYDEIWTPWNGGQTEKAKAFGYVNELNQLFVDIVRRSGGNNAKRHLLVEIYNTGLEYAFDPLTKIPADPAKHLALTVHYYTPPLFAILGNGEDAGWGVGVPSWGTAQEFKELNDNMDLLKKNCVDKGIPVVIGEYACSSKNRTQDVVRLFNVSVTEAIYSRGMCPMLWDVQGAGQYDRTTSQFKDPVFLEQMMAIPAKYPRSQK